MKTLIIYYSFGGNTRKIVEMMEKNIDADVLKIETVVPYTGGYDEIVNQGQEEVNRGYQPEIKEINIDLAGYGRIILGSPVWWYTFAPAMNSFLHQIDFIGKDIYTFATNGGWIGHTFQDFKNACIGAKVHSGLNIKFEGDRLETSEDEIIKWISRMD